MKIKRIKIVGVFVCTIIMGLNASAQFAGGDGSLVSPYQIANASQLQYLSGRMINDPTNYNTAYYVLTADIDMNTAPNQWIWCGDYNSSTFAVATGGTQTSNFVPIGGWSAITTSNIATNYRFKGNFDGQGYTISNLKCKKPTTSTSFNNVGLFGYTENASIRNVTLVDCEFSGYRYVGGIIGQYTGSDVIENCHVVSTEVHGHQYTGGIVGYSYAPSSGAVMSNCSVKKGLITNTTNDRLGGISGQNRYTVFNNCSVDSTQIKIADGSEVGGMIGFNEQSNINHCNITNSSIQALAGTNRIGGLIGYNLSYSALSDCYAANIDVNTSHISTGGLIGLNSTYSSLTRCFVENSNVTVTGGNSCVGGLIGRCSEGTSGTGNFRLDSCYSSYVNVVSGGSGDYCGGLVGWAEHNIGFYNCYATRCKVFNGTFASPTTAGNWYGGMIGWTSYNCIISECYATYCDIHGGHDVGGLIGDPGDEATSVYEKCYSTYCDVYGTQYVGGLFGGGNAAFTIRNCYSSLCKVSSTSYVGGLLGYGGACYIQNSYSTNVVIRRASTNNAGGLGANLTNASRITNSYYIDTFKGSDSWTPNGDANRGIAYTSTQMLDPAFVETLNNSQNPQIWFQDTSLYVNGGYPVLAVSRGREGTTYQIWTVDDLRKLSQMVYDGEDTYERNFSLMANIDFTNAPTVGGLYSNNYQLRPIGYYDDAINNNPFYGHFDGNNFRISNLQIVNHNNSCVGLFGYIGTGASIRNVAIYNSIIEGDTMVGGIIGYAFPSLRTDHVNVARKGDINISNCYSRIDVAGNNYVGGLIGYSKGDALNNNATVNITNCYSRTDVLNNNNTKVLGGFVGYAELTNIANAYSTGKVSTNKFLGLAGSNANITNTYALNYAGNATSMTKGAMKVSGFTATLGGSPNWSEDDVPWTRNNGYPILGYEPSSADLVIIEDEETITVANLADFNNRPTNIIIEDGGSLINNYTSGNFTNVAVERGLLNEQYVFIGSAFGNVKVGEYLGEDGGRVYNNVFKNSPVSILKFNYGTNKWGGDPGDYTYLGYNSQMLPAQGYLAYVLDPYYVNDPQWLQDNQGLLVKQSFNGGTLWNKDTTFSIYNGGSPNTVESYVDGMWYSLSNPFSANLWVRPFLNTNTNAQGDVLYTLAADRTWNILQRSDLNARVKIGEGFFVASKLGVAQRTQQFVFNRAHMTKATSKASLNETQIKITAKTGGCYEKEAYIKINELASNGFDPYDAYKMLGMNSNVCEPYFIVDSSMIAINSISVLPYECPMNISSKATNNVTLTFNNIPEDIEVTLIDGEQEIAISNGDTYPTIVSEGQNAERFRIRLNKLSNGLANVTTNGISLWVANDAL
ncbi:MAG: hypothetical protein LBO06_04410, partial [Bacteroidales bacterium]|nr:hypothetical protein [Bacteroidales bacterium]